MSEDALYGDLEELAESATMSNLRDQVAAAEERRRAVEAQLKEALANSEEGRKANEILARNISILYNTAKAELDRKNRKIESLETELHQLKTRGSGRSIG